MNLYSDGLGLMHLLMQFYPQIHLHIEVQKHHLHFNNTVLESPNLRLAKSQYAFALLILSISSEMKMHSNGGSGAS